MLKNKRISEILEWLNYTKTPNETYSSTHKYPIIELIVGGYVKVSIRMVSNEIRFTLFEFTHKICCETKKAVLNWYVYTDSVLGYNEHKRFQNSETVHSDMNNSLFIDQC